APQQLSYGFRTPGLGGPMRPHVLLAIAIATFALLFDINVSAEPATKPLRNDATRAQLARRAMSEDVQGLAPALLTQTFKCPADAGDGIYGIDVSHHNEDGQGKIDWRKLTDQSIFFVYAKATQGKGFFDGRFARTWRELGKLQEEGREVYRGAYHFLSATV